MSDFAKLNQSLRQEVCEMTPNRIDDLLARLDAYTPSEETETPVAARPKRAPVRLYRQMAAAMLALVLLGGGIFYGVRRGQRSTVIIDADAPILFTVDGFDRVRSVEVTDPLADAVDASRCEGMSLNDAVVDVAGQLVAADRLTATNNAVLVSVLEDGGRRAEALAQKTSSALNKAVRNQQIAPAVMLMTLPETNTAGKPALIEKFAGDVTDPNTAKLLDASVQDLIFYAAQQEDVLADSRLVGSFPQDAYCSEQQAIDAALAADQSWNTVERAGAVLGWQEAELVYIVSLQTADHVRLYCVSARTGEVLDVYTPEQPITEPAEQAPVEPAPVAPAAPVTPASPATPQPTVPQPTTQDARDAFNGFVRFWDDIDDWF